MAASMWRMNGLCGSMAGALLLCIMLFSCEVMGEGEDFNSTQSSDTGGPTGVYSTSATHEESVSPEKRLVNSDVDVANSSITNASDSSVQTFSLNVQCVGKEDIPGQTAIKVEVQKTTDCEETKRIFEDNPSSWCSSDCTLNIFQEGKTVLVSSNDVKPAAMAEVLQSENVKKKLGLTKIETPPSSGSSVLVGILVSGLLVAIGIIAWYFKCQRKPGAKDAKLAEEAYPVDKENQGNTLVSEAPLNPPPETQEKPNVNGESPEADKNPPPPTNGHSTAKTADTEL